MAEEETTYRHKLRGNQYLISELTDREILICGPSGCGTDRACLEKLMVQAQTHAGAQLLVARKVAKSIVTSAQATLKREVLPELIASGNVWFQNGNRETPTGYAFSNGSMIAMEGLDDSRKILSSKWDMVYVQNATDLDLEDWEDLLLTLQGDKMGYTQMIADCLPQHPSHWLKLRCDAGKTTYFESRLEDNPKLFHKIGDDDFTVTRVGEDHLARLNDLSGVRRKRNKDGIWAAAEGLIYDKFDPVVHMVKDFAIPSDWGRIWSIDWGFKHPFVWQNWVRAPDGQMILAQEIHMTGRTVPEHAEQILRVTRGQPRPEAIVCDHDAGDREILEKALSKEWGLDVETIAARKSVKTGIAAVQKRIKHRDIVIMHGSLVERDPELVKLSQPTCLAEEKTSYVWADSLQDHPVKKADDSCDAERYAVMQEDSGSSLGVRMRR